MAIEEEGDNGVRSKLLALEKKYAHVPKKGQVGAAESARLHGQVARGQAAGCMYWNVWLGVLAKKYALVPKKSQRRFLQCCHANMSPTNIASLPYATSAQPHPDIGCWWTLYDYGLETVRGWKPSYKHPYPGEPQGLQGASWHVGRYMRTVLYHVAMAWGTVSGAGVAQMSSGCSTHLALLPLVLHPVFAAEVMKRQKDAAQQKAAKADRRKARGEAEVGDGWEWG